MDAVIGIRVGTACVSDTDGKLFEAQLFHSNTAKNNIYISDFIMHRV